jgi:hypothetical protein
MAVHPTLLSVRALKAVATREETFTGLTKEQAGHRVQLLVISCIVSNSNTLKARQLGHICWRK